MSWRDKYMKNMVSTATLTKLVESGKLAQEDVDSMISDRLTQLGY